MPTVDATALTGLGQTVVQPAYFIWLDFVGGAVRMTNWGPGDVTIAASGDSEFDGTYEAQDPTLLSVGDVSNQTGGSETLTVSLSGIVGIDTSVLNIIGDRTKWYRRTARLWMRVHDEAGTQQGAVVPFYTGYMIDVRIVPKPETQTIEVECENYLSIMRDASRRTYLDQGLFDAADISAKATVGSASGAATGPAAMIGASGFAGTNREGLGHISHV